VSAAGSPFAEPDGYDDRGNRKCDERLHDRPGDTAVSELG